MTTVAKTPKAVNYTAEQTAKMVEMYSAKPTAETVAELATMFAKTARSIVAKLSREKVYKAKTYATKTGEAVVKKDELADELTSLAELTAAEADSLTKANKTALKKIVVLLKDAKNAYAKGYAQAEIDLEADAADGE